LQKAQKMRFDGQELLPMFPRFREKLGQPQKLQADQEREAALLRQLKRQRLLQSLSPEFQPEQEARL